MVNSLHGPGLCDQVIAGLRVWARKTHDAERSILRELLINDHVIMSVRLREGLSASCYILKHHFLGRLIPVLHGSRKGP